MRKVTVKSTQSSKLKDYMTDVTTWGDLKGVVDAGTMKAILKETRTELAFDSSLLPEGDFTIFLFPGDKIKSGVDIEQLISDLQDEVNEAFNKILEKIEDGDYEESTDEEDDDFNEVARELGM